MWIGSALVLIFILYLIDKHNRWRQALKLVIGLVLLCIVTVGGFWGWQKYQDYRQEKEERAEAAAQEARMLACIDRLKQIPVPNDAANADVPADIQRACEASPDATTFLYVSLSQPLPPTTGWVPDPPKAKPQPKPKPESRPNCDAVPCSDWAAVTYEYGSEIQGDDCFETGSWQALCKKIAVLNRGDRVQILSEKTRSSDGTDIYKVKFQQWTGWTRASELSPDSGEGK